MNKTISALSGGKKYFLGILALIVFLGAGLRIYNLGEKSFDRDEFFELNSSYGYFKTGEWLSWDFGKEKPFDASLQDKSSTERAEIYRWQLAQIYNFFEPTESSARAVSVFWGIVSILLMYFITFSFTGNHWIALLAALLTAIGESGIVYSRRLRMYAMFFPAYLVFSWLVYKFYEAGYVGKNKIFKLFYDKFKINLFYFLPMLFAGLISYNIHMLTANIMFTIVAFSFCGWILWGRKEKKLNKYSITLAVIFIVYFVVSTLPNLAKFYKSFKKQVDLFKFNPNYFTEYFTDFMFPVFGFILALAGAWYLFKKLERKKEATFIFLSAFVPLFFAIFTWVRTPSGRYIYFIQSFGTMLMAVGIYSLGCFLFRVFGKRKKFAAVILLIVFASLVDFSYFKEENENYVHAKNSYYPDFKNILPYILENKKENDIFIMRAYRSYYWRGEDIKIFDIQKLPLEEKNCQEIISEIIAENKSGWFILPKIDLSSVCKNGVAYLDENYGRIKNEKIPTSVLVYHWEE